MTVVCLIFTTVSNWNGKAEAVRQTWAKRCHRSIFFYSKFPGFEEHDIYKTPGTVVLDVPEGKYDLTPKTFAALNYSYARYGEVADWFMKADDDVFVIWENLIQLLTRYDATRPHYIGAPSPPSTQFPRGYNSGGAAYLISKPAASALLGTNPRCRRRLYAEDMAVGKCLEQLKVFPTNTLDNSGRQRFHSGNPTTLFRRDPTYMKFFYINFTGIEFGDVEQRLAGQMLSSEAITFHYTSPEQMYTFDYLLRGLRRAALEVQ